MVKDIVFVGDSYCASFDKKRFDELGLNNRTVQHAIPNQLTHPSIVAEHFECSLQPHGYGGASWWYSRVKFINYMQSINNQFDNILAIIFFHTQHNRINNSWNTNLIHNMNLSARKEFYAHINDGEFDSWACIKWFDEIRQNYSTVKTIHFHSFPDSIKWSDRLPGMVYNTPLLHISLGELTGTDEDIWRKCSYEELRPNHLSEHNNRALAQVIINSIENYQPGIQPIDLSTFEQINPNAHRFPNPGFGTE